MLWVIWGEGNPEFTLSKWAPESKASKVPPHPTAAGIKGQTDRKTTACSKPRDPNKPSPGALLVPRLMPVSPQPLWV